jgi:hypothetical protein
MFPLNEKQRGICHLTSKSNLSLFFAFLLLLIFCSCHFFFFLYDLFAWRNRTPYHFIYSFLERKSVCLHWCFLCSIMHEWYFSSDKIPLIFLTHKNILFILLIHIIIKGKKKIWFFYRCISTYWHSSILNANVII